MLVLVALPAAAAQAVIVPTKNVAIVPPSTTCKSTKACYSPANFTIAPGTKVVWTNKTTLMHTVSRCTPAACAGHSGGTGKDAGPNSPILNARGIYSFTFHGAGTYLYYCKVHGFAIMHASFTVS